MTFGASSRNSASNTRKHSDSNKNTSGTNVIREEILKNCISQNLIQAIDDMEMYNIKFNSDIADICRPTNQKFSIDEKAQLKL